MSSLSSNHFEGRQLRRRDFNIICIAYAIMSPRYHFGKTIIFQILCDSPGNVFKNMMHFHGPPGHQTSRQQSPSGTCLEGNFSHP
ncbi:hypothetical protein TNCV_3424291 [Trichonephila clavipes]|nr:hypothetical protein TNCV_3424291 [Trichonephila clavipes]